MGMPSKLSEYPKPPTQDAVATWQSMKALQFNKLKQHFQEYRSKIAALPPSEQNALMKREESRVSKLLTPPTFLPARDAPSTTYAIPLIAKKTREQKLQAAGFSRCTFHWMVFPFQASSWNQSVALIVANSFYSWAKKLPELDCADPGNITLMVGRWVSGQGKLMAKEAKNKGSATRSKEKAKNAQQSRVKKQIAAQRLKSAQAQFPLGTDFQALFTTTNIVSDLEDDEGNLKPIKIIPEWRSKALNACIEALDHASALMCTSKLQLLAHHRLHDRSKTWVGECPTLADIPRHLPEDAYCSKFVAKLSDVERVAIQKTPPINLATFQAQLEQKTRRQS